MRLLTFFTCLVFLIALIFCSVSLVFAFRGDENPNVGNARTKQSEVDGLHNELVNKLRQLEEEYAHKKIPLLIERNKILSSVPGFWRRAITNHPSFGRIAFRDDEDRLQALVNIEIEDLHGANAKLPDVSVPSQVQHDGGSSSQASPKYVIKLTFENNPYFSDRVLWRLIDAYNHDVSQARVSGVTWLPDKRPEGGASFFQFFEQPSHHSQTGGAGRLIDAHRVLDVAHLLRYEILANPFTYYDIPTYADIAAEDARRREELYANRDEDELAEKYAREDAAAVEAESNGGL